MRQAKYYTTISHFYPSKGRNHGNRTEPNRTEIITNNQTLINEKLQQIKQLFPEIFCENQIDWEKLKLILGAENLCAQNERYQLNWAGKTAAYRALQSPTFNTLIPCQAESVDFDTTQNVFIEAENMEALKILQKAYAGSVKMIYIDPPYNTGKDSFIYPDKFSETRDEYAKRVGDKDTEGYLKRDGVFQGAFRLNSKDSGHYHSNWLNMMLPRLHLAKTLLRDDGVIFISIDDNEQAQLKLLCDEVFGAENFVSELIQLKGNAQNDAINIQKNHEYVLCYAKYLSEDPIISKQIFREVDVFEDNDGFYYLGSGLVTGGEGGTLNRRPNLGYTIYFNPKNHDFIALDDYNKELAKTSNNENLIYQDNENLIHQGYIKIRPPKKGDILGCWTWALEKFNSEKNRISITQTRNGFSILKKERVSPNLVSKKQGKLTALIEKESNLRSILEFGTSQGTTIVNDLIGKKIFNNPKNPEMLSELISAVTQSNDIILDFFSGSGTTAHAVMQLNAEDGGNRRYICVQLPEETDEKSESYKAGYTTIAEISKERIRRAGKHISGSLKENQNVDTGFKVFKLAPSAFKQWQPPSNLDAGSLEKQMEIFTNVLESHATPENMAYELALRLGFQLTDKFDFSGSVVWLNNQSGTRKTALFLETFSDELLHACLQQSPQKIFALDRVFQGNDALKTNAFLQCQDAGVKFETL